MGKVIDLTGKTFGEWTVLYQSKRKDYNGGYFWHCKCSCGTERDVSGNNLRYGKSTSCGCKRKKKGKIKDLTGQRFGRLVALEPTEERKNKYVVWKCQCDCGNIAYVISNSLLTGNTKSCGCIHHEMMYNRCFKDLTGQKFHHLTVLKKVGSDENGKTLWECECDCEQHNHIIVKAGALISGNTQSCGCIRSRGERKISALLKDNNIVFEQEKTFDNCYFKDTNKLARFDFYVNNQYLIEFDSELHYFYTDSGWNTKERYEKTKEHDMIKNQWCFNNNIPLIRIPYWQLNELNIEDLQLETTKFLVKETAI